MKITRYLRKKILAFLRSLFPNHKDLLKEEIGTLIVYFLYAAIFIIILPIVLSNKWFYIVDFSQTGQIGDTIGGIMGPFVALIATLLTFFAFWVQFEANKNQREDISIERHEAKYYKMLDIYSSMTNGLEVHGIRGKEAFAELVGEFTYTFFTVDKIFDAELCNEQYLNQAPAHVKGLIQHFISNKKDKYMYITAFSYNLFFYGKQYMVVDLEHGERTALGEALKKIVLDMNNKNNERTYVDYVKAAKFELQNPNAGLKYPLFEGHSDFLGHYFRHLFQMVKYVASLDDSLFNENDKEEYVKMLRAQMSDYEQILLYYNSLSEQGSAWNKKHGDRFPEDTGYIARFRMIKNFPPNFPMFGILPHIIYKDDSNRWEKNGKKFFEHGELSVSIRAAGIDNGKI